MLYKKISNKPYTTLNRPEAMNAMSPAGFQQLADWLFTGDLVTADKEGYISYKGRKKELYIQGGFNVLPAEVENVLTTHPDISIAAGIGVPDPFYGEVGRYYIVLNAGKN